MRWIRGMVPLAAMALVGAGIIGRPPLLAAADPPWQPPACTDSGPPGLQRDAAAPAAWFRVDGVLDASGTLAGQRLWLGLGGGVTRHVDLPAESFATGPAGSVVLVGADDGARSQLSLVDIARGCATSVVDDAAVVRSGLLALDRRSVLAHRVDRATRADLGVWRMPVAGGRAVRVLGGAGADERYGRTFTTELRWANDGRLVVTSCGERACRTRLLDTATGRTVQVGPTGVVIGTTADGGVIAHAVCPGYPCALLRFGADGDKTTLVPAAGRAAMAGNRVVYESPGVGLRALDLKDGSTRALDGSAGLVPLGDGSSATAGAGHAAGEVLLAQDGRLDPRSARVLGPIGWAPVSIREVGR